MGDWSWSRGPAVGDAVVDGFPSATTSLLEEELVTDGRPVVVGR